MKKLHIINKLFYSRAGFQYIFLFCHLKTKHYFPPLLGYAHLFEEDGKGRKIHERCDQCFDKEKYEKFKE